MPTRSRIGFLIGLAAFATTLLIDSPHSALSPLAWRAAGLGILMASWWMSECLPLAVTSLVPVAVAPLAGLSSIKDVSAAYAHPLIFLFLGGFILSIAIERCGLHLRIARSVIAAVGSNPRLQIGSIMLVTAFLSMWISNTATAVMMLPIGISIAKLLGESDTDNSSRFSSALLLGIAYSASIGGLATLIGTPPNALLAAYLENSYSIKIGFAQWMLFGVPFSATLLLLTWAYLTRNGFQTANGPDAHQLIRKQLQAMGPMSRDEKSVLIVFTLAALSWIFRSQIVNWSGLDISDTSIAILAAIILFILPSSEQSGSRILEWRHMDRLPFGVLLLFGGGLALASIIKETGLADTIGSSFESLDGLSIIWIILIVATTVTFLTEVTSNTATAAALLPLMGPVALSLGDSPATLAIPAAIAASCAFMLPVATPPNAIVFATGELKIEQMARAGFALNILSILLIGLSAKFLIPLVF